MDILAAVVIADSVVLVSLWEAPTRTSCRHKRELYLLCRNSNDINFKNCYKSYCRILSSVISAAKRLHYDRLIVNSKDKKKTTCKIVKSVTGKRFGNKSLQSVYINYVLTENQQLIADSFQNYFLSTADKTISNTNNNEDIKDNNCID
jgi:trehalose-6-phosphate synthase